MAIKQNIIYISHGAGPMPLLGDPGHRDMVATLQAFAKRIGKPSAVLVISAHWEARVPSITAGNTPQLIYDYGGFPAEAYQIQYPCSGEPELAEQVYQSFANAGIDAALDSSRGFDHGMFVPLKIMYPDADIPCVQISLKQSLNAAEHLAMGRALRALQWDNLLVIGSGASFHNIPAFFSAEQNELDQKNAAFEQWLTETLASGDISETDRRERLVQWEAAPFARFCHPREEHLLPLHVCYGMAGDVCEETIPTTIMGKQALMFHWIVPGEQAFTGLEKQR